MGRRAQGWKIKQRGRYFYVRFRHKGEQYNLSTGQTDSRRAAIEAASIYSGVVDGNARSTSKVTARTLTSLDVLLAEWLAAIEGVLDVTTVATYKSYTSAHWLARWSRLGEVATDAAVANYVRERLRVVLKKSVWKELAALFGFFAWCKEQGLIAVIPARPQIAKTVRGVRSGHQRERPPEYSPEQIERALAALPMWSQSRFGCAPWPIRARFLIAYETSLRPATLNELRFDDLSADGTALTIRDEVDKTRFGRVVPLSPRAVTEFAKLRERSGTGLIFGKHSYAHPLKRAAKHAKLPSLAPYDFRHARGTHMADAGAALPGIAYVMGHKHLTTTSRYIHPSRRAAEAAIELATPALSALREHPTPPVGTGSQQIQDVAGLMGPDSSSESTRETTPISGNLPPQKPVVNAGRSHRLGACSRIPFELAEATANLLELRLRVLEGVA